MSVIRFFSEAGGEVIMLSSTVDPVIKKAEIIFHDQGAFLASDLGEIRQKLHQTIEQLTLTEKKPEEDDDEESEDEEKQQKQKAFVALKIRFYPLMQLLEQAQKKDKHVYWETL